MATLYSAVAAHGIATASTPEAAVRLARAAELGHVAEVRAGALRPHGHDVWSLRRGRLRLECLGTVTLDLFTPDELQALVGAVGRRLGARA